MWSRVHAVVVAKFLHGICTSIHHTHKQRDNNEGRLHICMHMLTHRELPTVTFTINSCWVMLHEVSF